ncbi:MAG: hypothetical protein JSS32_05480 [Verrucomicrobia bacterium]|nr:hypothetical protein [Verrucomicrobiota bacterium]
MHSVAYNPHSSTYPDPTTEMHPLYHVQVRSRSDSEDSMETAIRLIGTMMNKPGQPEDRCYTCIKYGCSPCARWTYVIAAIIAGGVGGYLLAASNP